MSLIDRLRSWQLALLTGGLLSLAWPAIGSITPLLFIAWVPLLIAQHRCLHQGGKRFWWLAFLAVLSWNLLTTWWLFLVSEPLSTRLFSYFAPAIANSLLMTVPIGLSHFVAKRNGARSGAYALVFFWVAFEYMHMNWELQWPWLTLGNAFAARVGWVQWYEWTGVLGGSMWVLLLNLSVFWIWRRLQDRKAIRSSRPVVFVAVLLIAPLITSLAIGNVHEEQGETAEVVLVQPNIDPYLEKFGGVDPMDQLERMIGMADKAMTPDTRMVIFPETALQERTTCYLGGGEIQLQGLWENDLHASRSVQRLKAFLVTHPGVTLITGISSDSLLMAREKYRPTARPLQGSDRYYEAYNAAMMLNGDPWMQVYHKSKLVPGVELMPFEKILGSLSGLALDLGGTTGSLGAQEDRSVMVDGSGAIRVAPAICYESIFGEFMTAYVRNGANLLSIITNDGWWGTSPGHRQHLVYARLRAIETRRCIARAANTGISCFIDQKGNIVSQTAWWERATLRGTVRLNEELTFYVRHGDQLGRAAWLLGLLLLVRAFVRGRLRESASGVPS